MRLGSANASARYEATPVGFEPTRGDPIGLAGRRLNHSAKVSFGNALWCGEFGGAILNRVAGANGIGIVVLRRLFHARRSAASTF